MADGLFYDLWHDPNTLDGDVAVECWISHGPRAEDESFDPQPGDDVLVGDEEEPPMRAVVLSRQSDRVRVRLVLDVASSGVDRAAASG